MRWLSSLRWVLHMVERRQAQVRLGVTHARLKLILAFAVFRVALDIGYVTFVNANFAYAGYALDVEPSRYALSWLLTALAAIMMPARFTQAAHLFLAYLGAVMLTPLTSLYGLASAPFTPIAASMASYGVVRVVAILVPPFALPRIAYGRRIALAIAAAGLAFVIVRMSALGGLASFNLDLTAVYEFRDMQSDIVGGGIFNYVNVWAGKVMAPLLLALGLLYRRWDIVAIAVGAHVVLFGVTAHKAVIFYPAAVTGIWLLFRRRPALWVLPAALAGVVSLSLIVTLVTQDLMAASLLVRRVFFVPARLTLDYFEFFTAFPPVLWSNSVLAPFFDYPYELSVARTVGLWNGSGASANNGYVSSGYAHAHWIGVFVYSIILGTLLSVVNSIARNVRSQWFAAAVMFVPLMATVSSDLLTAMLTHGVLPSLVLLLLVASSRSEPAAHTERARASHHFPATSGPSSTTP